MDDKFSKKCSNQLIIREIKMKVTRRHHYPPAKFLKLKKQKMVTPSVNKDIEQEKSNLVKSL